ncbi:uncharacterized protein CTRU02_207531 [Colletotrichum truncatum]|uniref:Uncharacterized protein n=1 Tax=Colletotrichum truncatum TaxID=5467 RepID=A0ACC3Z152_COLTU|nr:uncharacterized protein CTRU02_00841 [Colletotrichum truncatum]KAF6800436.1 hypothetical protein CTRU02_00841 [Colletotrichum truncatum]
MNLIYSRSCLAIIASAGSGPEYGLPGVGKTARQLPQTFRCGSHVLRHWLYRPWVRKQIRFSTWNSRAWTFQEAALSPRRLYFTDYFALFEAGDHRDRGLESCIEGSTDCRSSLFMPAWRFDMNELWYVSTYVHRCLSVEADVFCAFQGFQTHLNDVSSDTYLMYGLEVDTKECDLSRALWWCIPHPIERLQERRKAPSWTWLGWRISSKWPHAAWWVVNSFYLGASVRYVGSAKLSLVYDDDYVFPWGTMTREQMVKLTSDRDDGSIKSLIANGWTFSVQDLLSPPPEDDSINPFKEDNPDARDKLARPSLVEKLERAFAFYGLHADQISDPRKALCLVLGSVHLAQGKPSDIVSENPGLLILVVASTDQGETWQRVEALYVEGKTELVDCQWAAFGWVKRKLRIY